MMSGARDFGDRGCLGEADLCLFGWLTRVSLELLAVCVEYVSPPLERANSAFSSSTGPDKQLSMLSAYI